MIHPGLAALKHWNGEEYAACYRARFSEIPDSETPHHCWRRGWKDADAEALESARHKQGREDHFGDTWGNLFDLGEEARADGVPFALGYEPRLSLSVGTRTPDHQGLHYVRGCCRDSGRCEPGEFAST